MTPHNANESVCVRLTSLFSALCVFHPLTHRILNHTLVLITHQFFLHAFNTVTNHSDSSRWSCESRHLQITKLDFTEHFKSSDILFVWGNKEMKIRIQFKRGGQTQNLRLYSRGHFVCLDELYFGVIPQSAFHIKIYFETALPEWILIWSRHISTSVVFVTIMLYGWPSTGF